ncbi:acyltransferase [Sphingomonas sp. Leaf33]|uniref:acyltransferase family protein n=1 Tax=Sphingomonas sp. Leaf33 TaxID=1736215 RepID=UPI0006FE0BC5|nr:acyltransferase [Sphingomonas sp. Leaf33]KQN25218.1 acyltransferase [Sphingomonas sp. Leaf33]
MTDRAELRALTSVRGLAAWLVVFYHIRGSIAGLWPPVVHALSYGYLAVDFFFLLSGFVIWLAWGTRLREGGLATTTEFLRRRIARIWPLHGVVLTGTALMALALAATGRSNPEQYPFAELPLHYLLIQNWGLAYLAWNDPAWSISCELFAYLLFAAVIGIVDLRRLTSVALFGIAAGLLLALHAVFRMRGLVHLGDAIPQMGLIRCTLLFGCGTILAALWVRWRGRRSASAIAAIAACVAATALTLTTIGWVPETLGIPTGFAALLLLLALTAGTRRNPLEGRAIHYLGDVSFATYLVHYPLWTAFKLAFVRDADAVPPLAIALYVGMVMIASVMLYHGVERPAQRAINGWRWRQPLAT